MSDTLGTFRPTWEIGPVLSRSWNLFKANAGILVGSVVVIAVTSGVLSSITQGAQVLAQQSGEEAVLVAAGLVGLVVGILSWAIQTFLGLGFARMMLHVVRGEPTSFGDLFSGRDVIVTGLLAGLLVALATLAGTCFLVVPGVILALGMMMVSWVVVDQGLGPVEAMKESWRLTGGEKGRLFLWALAACGVALVGLLACCVGLFVALPVLGLGTTIIYDELVRAKKPAG
jgi:uncharacterized membrane protein